MFLVEKYEIHLGICIWCMQVLDLKSAVITHPEIETETPMHACTLIVEMMSALKDLVHAMIYIYIKAL